MRLLILSAIAIFCSCQSHFASSEGVTSESIPESQKPAIPLISGGDKFKNGEVIKNIPLLSNPAQSFALFLPQGYSSRIKYPVIIYFDPHGDGTVPLNLYQYQAGENAYILVGSNSSKNGMSWEQTGDIARNLIQETKTRFSVDENKITLCGFSGGAKVAIVNAVSSMVVSAVIYCGAAVPISKPAHPLSLLGFTGTNDMNYSDQVLFDRNLPVSLRHYLIEWSGKHEWPNSRVFKEAFAFLKNGGVGNYEEKKPRISDESLAVEQNYKQTYINAFSQQDLNWWKKEIAMLNANASKDAMFTRLLGYISLACYSYAGTALRQNNLSEAEKILDIYQLADPGNKDCEAFRAEMKRKKSGN